VRERTPRNHREDRPDYSVLSKGGDPYVYPGTSVLRNKFGIKDASALTTLETVATRRRLGELSQSTVKTPNTLEGLKAIHRHIFQDVYHFAGRPRRVELFKPEPALGGASVKREMITYLSGSRSKVNLSVGNSSRSSEEPRPIASFMILVRCSGSPAVAATREVRT